MSERALPDAWDAGAITTEPTACVVIVGGSAGARTLEPMVRMGGAAAVHTVTDARLAARRCRELRPDLVLIDLDAPDVDGVELIAAIRRVLAEEEFLPVMILREGRSADRRSVPPAGAVDVVTKPFDHVELVGRVRNLLTMRGLYRTVRQHNVEVRHQV